MIDVDLAKLAGHVVHAFGDTVFPALQQMISKLLRALSGGSIRFGAPPFNWALQKSVAPEKRESETKRKGIMW